MLTSPLTARSREQLQLARTSSTGRSGSTSGDLLVVPGRRRDLDVLADTVVLLTAAEHS